MSSQVTPDFLQQLQPEQLKTAAARRFAQDTFVVTYCGEGHLAQDVLKMRSNGECHLSITERNLIKEAK